MCAKERPAARAQMITERASLRHESTRTAETGDTSSSERAQIAAANELESSLSDFETRDRWSEQEHERVAQVHKLHSQVVHIAIVLCTRFHSPKRALVTSVGRCTAAWEDRGLLHKSR